MEISAINTKYNVPSKAQYDNYQNAMTTNYPSYTEEEPKSSNMLGLTLLGILGIVGIGYGIYKNKDCKSLTSKLAEKETALTEAETKISDGLKKITDLESKKNTAEKALEKANEKILKYETKKPGIFTRAKNWIKGLWPKKKA